MVAFLSNALSRLANAFAVAAAVCTLILVPVVLGLAFANHTAMTRTVAETIDNLRDAVRTCTPEVARPRMAVAIAELEKSKQSVYDANTLAFLFQLMLFALMSVSGYLVSRALEALQEARGEAERSSVRARTAGSLIVATARVIHLTQQCATTSQLVISLDATTSEAKVSLSALIREQVKLLLVQVKEVTSLGCGVDPSIYDDLALEPVRQIHSNLERARKMDAVPEDVVHEARSCLDFLSRGRAEVLRRWETAMVELGVQKP